MKREWDKSNTSKSQVWHECYKNDTSLTRLKNFDLDNDTSKNIFSHPYVYYMASEVLQGEKHLHSKNYLLETPRSHAKMRLKSATSKTELFNDKSYIKKLHTRF